VLHVDILPLVSRAQLRAQVVAAVAMAGHVSAHADFGARRRFQEEMRIEAGNRLKPEERDFKAFGEIAQLYFGQVAMSPLNATELVEDGRCRSATLHGATEYIRDLVI
jgi:hypothetical protein